MAKRSLSDLSEEMITEVLLRLPVKSLLQCKSVCQPWLSTISNPRFVKSHIQRAITTASQNDDPTLLNIINVEQLARLAAEPLVFAIDPSPNDLLRYQQEQRRRQLVNQGLEDANAQDLSMSPLQFVRAHVPAPFTMAPFISCCNGIICLSNYNVAYLWNPSIKMFKKLPFPDSHTLTNHNNPQLTIGFGYDRISNEYKILRFVYKTRDDVVPMAKVYYVNANSCREFQGPNLNTPISKLHQKSNIVVDGVLYYDSGDQLVSFDLHQELFALVPYPIQTKMSDVMDFQGSVAMVFESGSGVDLWTLDDVSGELSWTKKFTIEYGLDDPDTKIWLSCYLGAKQFYGWKSLNGNYFVYEILYDYEKKETKYYGLQEKYVNIYQISEESEEHVRVMLEISVVPVHAAFKYTPVHAAFKYTETLVSLDGFEPMENARNI